VPVRDEHGQIIKWYGTATDVHELREAREALARSHAELEQRVEQRTAALAAANRELEAFSYSVSHDLRAPLRHVIGFIKLLDQSAGASLDEKSRRYVQTIAEAAQCMGTLIDDLLAFSSIGRAQMTETAVSLRTLVDEALRELAPETAGRHIDWHIGVLPEVHGDPALLRSAVVNLLSNAIKYTRRRDPARIEIDCGEQDGETVCFVRDNGAGFDMRFADKLFGVFQRLHRVEEFEGTGIGLANVRRIIQRHGGRIWAQAEVDCGATFYFSLPVKERSS
jgi:light-regulated signal transduction histidine kinase (bacteriophytochrome)